MTRIDFEQKCRATGIIDTELNVTEGQLSYIYTLNIKNPINHLEYKMESLKRNGFTRAIVSQINHLVLVNIINIKPNSDVARFFGTEDAAFEYLDNYISQNDAVTV